MAIAHSGLNKAFCSILRIYSLKESISKIKWLLCQLQMSFNYQHMSKFSSQANFTVHTVHTTNSASIIKLWNHVTNV